MMTHAIGSFRWPRIPSMPGQSDMPFFAGQAAFQKENIGCYHSRRPCVLRHQNMCVMIHRTSQVMLGIQQA